MNVEVKQLKDTQTGEVFVPLTHWDAVANKPEDIAKESTSQEISNKLNDMAKESTSQEILREVENVVVMVPEIQEDTDTIKTKIDELSTTFDDIYAQQLESIIG